MSPEVAGSPAPRLVELLLRRLVPRSGAEAPPSTATSRGRPTRTPTATATATDAGSRFGASSTSSTSAGSTGSPGSADFDLAAAIDLVERQRILPLLIDAVMSGVVAATPAQLADLQRREIAVASAQVSIEAALLDAIDLMSSVGVAPIALKGVACAHLDYPDPSLRQFGDADVLVPDERFGDVLGVLVRNGWEPGAPIPRRHLEFVHALPMRHPAGAGVDVHRAIGRRAVGRRISTASILRRADSFELAGSEIGAPDASDRLIHAAVHETVSTGDHRRLSTTADILVLAVGSSVDPATAVERAAEWRIAELVRTAIENAHRLAGLELSDRWREAFAALDGRADRDRLLEWAHLSDRRRPALEELAMWRELGWQERARYVDGYIRPGRDYFDKVGRDHRSQLSYLGRRLRSRVR